MYYASTKDLPHTLQDTLPEDAQKLYIDSYNRIWDEHANLGDSPSRATVANQQAWEVVNEEFVMVSNGDGGHWYHRGQEPKADEVIHRKKGFWARLGFGS